MLMPNNAVKIAPFDRSTPQKRAARHVKLFALQQIVGVIDNTASCWHQIQHECSFDGANTDRLFTAFVC